jgi:hypothetical protein
MNLRIAVFLIALVSWLALPATAADEAWIMSIPHAVSGEGIYKVQILEIDGQAQGEARRYAVSPGRHSVRVRMMLDVLWEPDLADAPRGPGWKELELDLVAGKSYQLAARLDAEAPLEAQMDRSYWEPFIYLVE